MTTGSISGTITNAKGQAMASVTMQIYSNWNGSYFQTPALIATTTTGSKGGYTFDDLELINGGITYTVYYIDGNDEYLVGQYTLSTSSTSVTNANLQLS